MIIVPIIIIGIAVPTILAIHLLVLKTKTINNNDIITFEIILANDNIKNVLYL